jgi:UDP-N-acetylglucosamine diphosphorylase / glucose-1-phosphate thymidylyltransferase / UDP-N-acetylgalactosamine diphosphorylase / glucosamine-1-phosphate N-acetyltransferase / galactosamine-1-phosphate N-acetyltransferase
MLALEDYLDLQGFPFPELFSGIETCYGALGEPIKAFCAKLKGREIHGTVMEGAYLEGDGIYIGKGTVVEPGAFIRGPVAIGENTEVRHGAYIRGMVVVGNSCVVGHATEVKASIFLNGAAAGHFAYVGDSILGARVNLGAGTKLANLKIISSKVTLKLEGEVIQTGFRKMGAVLGNDVELGCNSVTSPGTILPPSSLVYPAISIKGVFSKKQIFKTSNLVVASPL